MSSIAINSNPNIYLDTSTGDITYLPTNSNVINTTVSNGYLSTASIGSYLTYDGTYGAKWSTPTNPLEKLNYYAEFEIDKNNLLKSNIKGIRKNKFLFNCNYVENRIQPYEFIMSLIEEKKIFSVKIKVSDILTICYTNLRFIKIENNLNFNDDCDFSVIKVKFKYDEIKYENHKLSNKQLRTDKLKKIMRKKDEGNNSKW